MTDAARATARRSARFSTSTVRPVAAVPSAVPTARAATAPAVAVPLPTLLYAIAEAYAVGDAPLGERLFLKALDESLPWDAVCAAAARGIAAHHDEQSRA